MRDVEAEDTEEKYSAIKLNGNPITELRYADDTALLSKTTEGLNDLMQNVKKFSQNENLPLNAKKTKVKDSDKSPASSRHSFRKLTNTQNQKYSVLRIPWTARRTNQNILQELGTKERQLLKNIKQQKLKYFGHVVRHNNLEKLCLEGAVEGRRGRGRRRKRWTQDISDWLDFSVREASILAQDRDGFRSAVWEATSYKDPP
ncbi:endonuclease-reverse transcriptase [Elysia marginata]|uniref:Endonuclease-reverse transcriptase n=1 Tax=Elysia marginata TaxID=1093978 RepID=A0AAV4EQY8_9GAST|nr:endonuclease-reverse transcriptase [Elysia marginata]